MKLKVVVVGSNRDLHGKLAEQLHHPFLFFYNQLSSFFASELREGINILWSDGKYQLLWLLLILWLVWEKMFIYIIKLSTFWNCSVFVIVGVPVFPTFSCTSFLLVYASHFHCHVLKFEINVRMQYTFLFFIFPFFCVFFFYCAVMEKKDLVLRKLSK